MSLQTRLHPRHKLKLERREASFLCDGCKEPGFYSCYTCEKSCDFHLHRHCANPRPSLKHPFFKNCSFRWVESGLHGRVCDACGTRVRGFVYHCDICGKDLHPSCANLPRVLDDGGLRLELKKEISSECERCGWKKRADGKFSWGYVSTCKTFSYHISCMKDVLQDNCVKKEDSSRGSAVKDGGRESVKRTPMLQLAVRENKGRPGWKLAKMKKVVQVAVSIILAAVLGDPISLAATVIASLLSR
ncbi:unnamed protein product [Spirodela intermedia]|uniref:DC1 domain-containing protein n=1 Tax=Spirodela intermedia TaxID=51605 RepID=A0A7I8K0G4_SPIIN|nr:unnamed protein product [Spirodela intermedia]